ncbi:NTP transferase domain-containing protein [Flagellimonas lutimaris]|uniref:NTP transferase domain-containing protein n=1 Tax=Flagellimonas lutimaris TaxID=475082 RepID=UPI003F5CDF7C
MHKTNLVKPELKTPTKNQSKLFGLVLSGGASTRMGKDKGLVDYHGLPQREYLYQLLKGVCDDVFLSVQEKQLDEILRGFKTIVDQDKFKGPFNGILSAHEVYKDVAWLVLACDLPFMNSDALQHLIEQRNPEKYATAFVNQEMGQPEPLACIWETNGLEKASEFLKDSNNRSPKIFLMNTDIELVQPKDGQVLFNANSLSDYDFVKKKLEGQERD